MPFAGGRLKLIGWLIAAMVGGLGLPPTGIAQVADDQPVKKAPTEDELLRKRILESLAGIRDPKAPKLQTLHGPELSEREKAIHVLSRLGFGPTPGEIDDVLKTGGWQAWLKRQMDPASIDDAT